MTEIGTETTRQDAETPAFRATPRTVVTFARTLLALLPWLAAWSIALALAQSAVEGVGLLLLAPLLQLAGVPVQHGPVGDIASLVARGLRFVHLRPTLATVLILYFAVSVVQSLQRRSQQLATFSLQITLAARLRQRSYLAIANADWLFFSRSRSSDFVHALTTQTDRVSNAGQSFVQILTNVLVILVYLALALKLSALLTGIVLLCGLALLIVLKGRTRASSAAGEGITTANNDLYHAAMEHLAAMKTTKSYAAQERHTELFAGLTEQIAVAGTRAMRGYADTKLWFDMGAVALLCAILYVSLKVLDLATASILLLLFLFARIIPRFSGIQTLWQYFLADLSAFVFVEHIRRACEDAAEPTGSLDRDMPFHDEIRLERVSFSYREDGSHPALVDLDLSVRAGQTTAIVGPSGAGKSTVADLIIGLIRPNSGAVLVDGEPLGPDRIGAWRSQIGYVAQETFLFHDTVRGNLLWAHPDASESDLQDALRMAAADTFVAALPRGLETVVGERGVQLSGGERQRLALARALLRKPSLLVLDEATSSIDVENERRIQEAIERLHGRLTIVIITHRLGTVQRADAVNLLDQGRLLESGAWEELMAHTSGRFRTMFLTQNFQPVIPA